MDRTLHDQIHAYLDGDLAPDARAAFEAALAADTTLAARLRAAQSERALRAAALSTYAPAAAESAAHATAVLAACRALGEAPAVAGRIAWAKRVGAVAAMLFIAAGGFYAGRATTTPEVVKVTEPEIKYVVVGNDPTSAEPRVVETTSPDEADKLARAMANQDEPSEPSLLASSGIF